MCPRSVPRVLDIMQVYFPASSSPASTMIRSWLAAAKKCRSVTSSGPSSLVQLRRGAGLPPAMHCSTAVSPRATVLSSRGLMNDGVSTRKMHKNSHSATGFLKSYWIRLMRWKWNRYFHILVGRLEVTISRKQKPQKNLNFNWVTPPGARYPKLGNWKICTQRCLL